MTRRKTMFDNPEVKRAMTSGLAYGKTQSLRVQMSDWLEEAIADVRKTKKPRKILNSFLDGPIEIIVRPAKLKKR